MSIEAFLAEPNGEGLRIGIVQARFNEPVCNALRIACIEQLVKLGVKSDDVVVASVPGALEIPFVMAQMAQTNQFDALIALGAVIRGETYHFEIVSNESAAGVSRIGLDYNIAVANAILTTNTDEQAQARAAIKGAEAASVALEMVNLAASIRAMASETND